MISFKLYKNSTLLSFLLVFSFVFYSCLVHADERDDAYETALKAVMNLNENSGNSNAKEIRDLAVIAAEKLKLLAFLETEYRQTEKVGLPVGLSSGNDVADTDLLSKAAGQKIVDIEDVPLDWFSGQLERARENLTLLIGNLDEGTELNSSELTVLTEKILQSVNLIIYPPKN